MKTEAVVVALSALPKETKHKHERSNQTFFNRIFLCLSLLLPKSGADLQQDLAILSHKDAATAFANLGRPLHKPDLHVFYLELGCSVCYLSVLPFFAKGSEGSAESQIRSDTNL